MARWPSLHARLKGMKPHLPKKTDTRPTLGKYIELIFDWIQCLADRLVFLSVLDIDETLLHTYRHQTEAPSDPDYVVYAEDKRSVLTAGILRPGVTEFLIWASGTFEVVVWTAGDDDYANMVRTVLDPENKYIT